MRITIRHEINFITSTITIIVKKDDANWDCREYDFGSNKEMRSFITNFESALMMVGQDWQEEIIYITE